MTNRNDNFSGNILLYDYLATKRMPVFLRRNLSLAQQTDVLPRSLATVNTGSGRPGREHKLPSAWTPPTWDRLDDMMEDDYLDQFFRLDLCSVKPLDKARKKPSTSSEQDANSLLRLKAWVDISINVVGSRRSWRKPRQTLELKAMRNESNNKVTVTTAATEVMRRDLPATPTPSGSNKTYQLKLQVEFQTTRDAEKLYDCLGLSNKGLLPEHKFTAHEEFLDCATAHRTLLLRDRHKTARLALEVSMSWADPHIESVLVREQQRVRETQSEPQPDPVEMAPHPDEIKPVQFELDAAPTPEVSVTVPSLYRITYVNGDNQHERTGLHCSQGSCTAGPKITDIEGLRMHLKSYHPNFVFSGARVPGGAHGVEYWRFSVETVTHGGARRASSRADDPRELSHVASSYSTGPTIQDRPQQPAQSRHRSSRAPPSRSKNDPREVQDVPVFQCKVYVVPPAPPKTTFFRQFTKRALKPGEEISGSEDEMDDEPLRLRKHAEIDQLSISPEMKRFLKLYDDFMHGEKVQADVHVADAVVRFIRAKGPSIWQSGVFGELEKKLMELQEDGQMSVEMQTACIKMVRDLQPNIQSNVGSSQTLEQTEHPPAANDHSIKNRKAEREARLRRARKGKGRAKVSNVGPLTPVMTDSDGDIEMHDAATNIFAAIEARLAPVKQTLAYDQCFCGEDALSSPSATTIIACSDMVRLQDRTLLKEAMY